MKEGRRNEEGCGSKGGKKGGEGEGEKERGDGEVGVKE